MLQVPVAGVRLLHHSRIFQFSIASNISNASTLFELKKRVKHIPGSIALILGILAKCFCRLSSGAKTLFNFRWISSHSHTVVTGSILQSLKCRFGAQETIAWFQLDPLKRAAFYCTCVLATIKTHMALKKQLHLSWCNQSVAWNVNPFHKCRSRTWKKRPLYRENVHLSNHIYLWDSRFISIFTKKR